MTNLKFVQGDDFSAIVTVTDGLGAPANLTGYTARAQIRRDVADASEVVYEMETQITGDEIALTIPHAVSATLTGRYRWDLELVSSGDIVSTLLTGSVVVTQEVTEAGRVSFTATLAQPLQLIATSVGIPGPPGTDGDDGQRGSLWFEGDGPPGVIPNALPQDMYLDSLTGDVYVFS